MARPTLYQPEYAKQARKLCQLGATDREIAEFFEVGERTFYDWQLRHPELARALRAGKSVADKRVERKLYERAVGYTYDSEELVPYDHIETLKRGDAETVLVKEKRVLRVPVVKHVPPDVTAQIFWSKNRMPGKWRDIKAVAVSGDKNGEPLQLVHKIERYIIRANPAAPNG